jgi:hypothetical protein
MKRALIASFAALGIVAAPAIAATTTAKAGPNVSKTEKKAAKAAAKNAKVAPKAAPKSK